MAERFTLRKNERLYLRRQMDKLFEGGSALMAFPLRVLYLQTDDPDAAEVSMLVSVSKKRFHHAVDRNKVKRRVREAFRLRKFDMSRLKPDDKKLMLAFIYVDTKICSSLEMEKAMTKVINKISVGNDSVRP
jgi:ribonuclease P protein component